jgi:hypothetical protein
VHGNVFQMAPFVPPKVVITGFKEKIDALTVQGKPSFGNLNFYYLTWFCRRPVIHWDGHGKSTCIQYR